MNIYLKAALIAVGIVAGFFAVLIAVTLLCKFFGWGIGAFYTILAVMFITGALFMGILEQLKRIERDKAREAREASRTY